MSHERPVCYDGLTRLPRPAPGFSRSLVARVFVPSCGLDYVRTRLRFTEDMECHGIELFGEDGGGRGGHPADLDVLERRLPDQASRALRLQAGERRRQLCQACGAHEVPRRVHRKTEGKTRDNDFLGTRCSSEEM